MDHLAPFAEHAAGLRVPDQRHPVPGVTEDPLAAGLEDVHVVRDVGGIAEFGETAQVGLGDPLRGRTRHRGPQPALTPVVPLAEEPAVDLQELRVALAWRRLDRPAAGW